MWKSLRKLIAAYFYEMPYDRHPLAKQRGGWGAFGAALVGAAVSSNAASSASNQANKEFAAQQGVAAEETGMAEGQLKIGQDMYSRYQQLYQPVQDQYLKELTTPVDASVQAGLAAGDVQTAAAQNQAALQRQEQSYGMNPNSGRAQALSKEGELQTSAAAAGAATSARRWAQNTNLQRMGAANNLGDNVFNQAESTNSAALSGLSGAGAIYGQQAQTYAQAAGAAGGAEGNFLGQAAYYGGNALQNYMKTPPPGNSGIGAGDNYNPTAAINAATNWSGSGASG